MTPEEKREYGRRYRAANAERLRAQRKAYRERNKELIQEQQRVKYQRHGEKYRKRQREHNEQNKEAVKAERAAYYERNREEVLRRNAAYRQRNRDKVLEQKREHYLRNRDELNAQGREWYQRNQVAENERSKLRSLKNRHGMRPEDRATMWAAQDGRCYLCGGELESGRNMHIEHDHSCCGKDRSCPICRRGLACWECNFIVGYAHDDPARLRRIADALEVAQRAVEQRKADHVAERPTLFP